MSLTKTIAYFSEQLNRNFLDEVIDNKDCGSMIRKGYSRKAREGIISTTENKSLSVRTLLMDYCNNVRPLLELYHSVDFIQAFERKLVESIKTGKTQFVDEIIKEVPINVRVLREHCHIAKQINTIYEQVKASQKDGVFQVRNFYPTHHASEDASEGFCLFAWRNILLKKLISEGFTCGGMDIDVHATGNSTTDIFSDKFYYSHYLDVTSTEVYPKFYKIVDRGGAHPKLAVDDIEQEEFEYVGSDQAGKRYWLRFKESSNTRQLVFEKQFNPAEMTRIINMENKKRIRKMTEIKGPVIDLCHIGVDAAAGDDQGNQALRKQDFSAIGYMHRELCERIKVVYFNEGGYRKKRKAEVSEIYNAFYTSSKKRKTEIRVSHSKAYKKRKPGYSELPDYRSLQTDLIYHLQESNSITLQQNKELMNGNIWGFEGPYFLKPDSLYKGKKVVILYETDNPSQGQVFCGIVKGKTSKKITVQFADGTEETFKTGFPFFSIHSIAKCWGELCSFLNRKYNNYQLTIPEVSKIS